MLRPYQREALDAVLAARRGGVRRLLVCLPTGAGKTVIFSELAKLARRQVLVLAHREELLAQAKEKLERALGGEHVVAIERGNERAPLAAKVSVCSIRSLHEGRLAEVMRGRDLGLIIYDECHHAAAEDNLRVLRQLGVFEHGWTGTLLGFTATTARGDGKGLDTVFERIVYTRSLPELISEGFLSPLRGFRVSTAADLTRLPTSGLDFREDELAEAVDIEERNAIVARSIQELARDRRTIAFCVNVNHARNLSRSLNLLGVSAGIVHGAMPRDVRAQALAEFRAGRTQVLANVAVLTEGFDDPGVSCIAMARPTRSE
ncbi:MAG TPA: DEAD/DEAH box helicase, partial [Polyangiaceae bacterium]